MNILVTGANGQLGNELRTLTSAYPNFNFIFTDIAELDITNFEDVNAFITSNQIDTVINCAAYTAVDKAETEIEMAWKINAQAVQNLAKACGDNKLLVHISTDYVFDGKGHRPYNEDKETNPISAYAKSKLGGEIEIWNFATNALIIRTSWLYSTFGNNFMKTMIKYGKERGKLNVVFDQIGTPTYAHDLAKSILDILNKGTDLKGINVFNYSNEGVCSWYDFAIAIMEETGIDCVVNPILSEAYPLPAARPFYSVLDKSKIKSIFGIQIPHWRESLRNCVNKLN